MNRQESIRRPPLRSSLALAIVCALARTAGAKDIPPGAGWDVVGDMKAATIDGRAAFSVRNGFAYRRDVALQDGTIEFDLRVTGERSFAYVLFRMAGDREHEEIYFRPHKARLPDTIQYNPVFQGRGQWQLFHDASSTAAIDLRPGVWTKVRLVLHGSRGLLFVGSDPKPALQIDRLARAPIKGYLGFRAFTPEQGGETVAISNISVTPAQESVAVPFPAPRAPAARPDGLVRSFSVSTAFASKAGAVLSVPSEIESGVWKTVSTEPDGLLLFARDVPTPPGRATVAARLVIDSAAAELRRFDVGFSDEVTVLVNGRPVFSADAGYSFNFPRQEGLIHLDQSSIYAALVAGRNEITFLVTDDFGGMGLMARDAGPVR